MITEFGGPEVVAVHDVPEPKPEAGQILIDVARCGVNFSDTLLREDRFIAAAALPLVPGGEVVGRTADGRRVAAMIQNGGYAEKAAIPENAAFPVPDEVDDVAAVALLAQGLTAWWLINHVGRVQAGESVVVHAAAGGVGSLAVQLAKVRGAGRVIAVASTPEKRDVALSLGADVAVDPAGEDLTAALYAANNGKPVDVVLEMTGGRITDQSIAALAPFGRLAFYGMASLVEPAKVSPRALQRGSLTISGFYLLDAFARMESLRNAYGELVKRVAIGELRVIHGGDYPMSEVRRAHEAVRSRQTTGKVVMNPRG
jgi:NADPH2:quinone reductase